MPAPKTRTVTYTAPTEADDFSVTVAQRAGARQLTISCGGGQATWDPTDTVVDATLKAFVKAVLKDGVARMGF